jgi:lipopolysaccharide biosynthesis glycosyltransferase
VVTRPAACCVATVTDAEFLPGTCVLLSSFLRHNPWFDGDIVVIQRNLPDDARRTLAGFPGVRWHDVGTELLERVATVTAAYPALARKTPIFYSLEAFNLPDYARVLKLDSDILCMGSAAGLMAMDAVLLACPDQPHFRHQTRDRVTYLPHASSSADTAASATFNAGMLLLAPGRLGAGVYNQLLDEVRTETWSAVRTGHTDSIVLNRLFERTWTHCPERYNYFISKDTVRYTRSRASLDDAVFVHFIGRRKPWHRREPVAGATGDDYRRALAWWDEARAAIRYAPVDHCD